MPTPELEDAVLTACRALLARGDTPSCNAIEAELGIHRRGQVYAVRRALIARGEIDFVPVRGRPAIKYRPDVPTAPPCDRCGHVGGYIPRSTDRPRRVRAGWNEAGVARVGMVCNRCHNRIARERAMVRVERVRSVRIEAELPVADAGTAPCRDVWTLPVLDAGPWTLDDLTPRAACRVMLGDLDSSELTYEPRWRFDDVD